MFKIGELSDSQMADQIVQDLNALEIKSGVIEENGLLVVYVENEKDFERAFDIFRVRLGFAPRFEVPEEFLKLKKIPWGTFSPLLIFVSLAISLLMLSTGEKDVAKLWFFSNQDSTLFLEISQGQWWRLVSPMFLHFGFLHIIFNMLVFKDFGPLVEFQHGPKRFLIWVFSIALASNIAQYLTHGPQFGGMSGVLFGLLGLIWMYKTFHASSEFSLPKSSVVMLLVWFFLCLFGLIPNIANMAHAVGLTVGMLFGIYAGAKDEREEKGQVKSTQLLFFAFIALGFSLLTLAVEAWKLGGDFYFKS